MFIVMSIYDDILKNLQDRMQENMREEFSFHRAFDQNVKYHKGFVLIKDINGRLRAFTVKNKPLCPWVFRNLEQAKKFADYVDKKAKPHMRHSYDPRWKSEAREYVITVCDAWIESGGGYPEAIRLMNKLDTAMSQQDFGL